MAKKTTTEAGPTTAAPKKRNSKPAAEQPRVLSPQEVKDLDAQDTHHVETASQLPVAQRAENEVAKYELAKEWIAAKKVEYSVLKIKDLEDKEGEKAVETAWREIRNKRLQVANKHKELKADYLVITRAIDGAKNEFTDLLEEIEQPLKKELDRIEAEREEIKQAAERAAQQKLQGRVVLLLDNGMGFNGNYYAIGDTISMDVVTLKGMADEQFDELLARVKAEKQRIEDAKAEAARKEQEEKDAIEKQRKDNEDRQRALDEQQAAINKQLEDIKKMRLQGRASQLEGLGMVYNYRTAEWEYSYNGVVVAVKNEDQPEAEWSQQVAFVTQKIKDLKDLEAKNLEKKQAEEKAAADKKAADDKAAQELQERTNTRVLELARRFQMLQIPGGYQRPGNEVMDVVDKLIITLEPAQWDEYMDALQVNFDRITAAEKAEAQRQQDQREADRVAALSDVERVDEYLRKQIEGPFSFVPQGLVNPEIKAAVKTFENAFIENARVLNTVLDKYRNK